MVNDVTEMIIMVGTQLEEMVNWSKVWAHQTEKREVGELLTKITTSNFTRREEIQAILTRGQYMSLIQQSWSVGLEVQQN